MIPTEINQQSKPETIQYDATTNNSIREHDTLSNSVSSSGSNDKSKQQKIKIYKKNLEYCMKKYNLPADAFEFKDEEKLKQIQQSIMEMRRKRRESGKKEFDFFNIK